MRGNGHDPLFDLDLGRAKIEENRQAGLTFLHCHPGGFAYWENLISDAVAAVDGPAKRGELLERAVTVLIEKTPPIVRDQIFDWALDYGRILGLDDDTIQQHIATGQRKAKPSPLVYEAPRKEQDHTWWREKLINFPALCDQEFPELKWVVPGLFPEGVTLVVSRPKLGKSWLFLQIGSAVANGVPTLMSNAEAPPCGDVLYLALEDSERRLQRRGKKYFGSNKNAWPRRLTPATEWKRLDQGGLEAIEAWAQSVPNPTLVLIDTLKRVRPPRGRTQTDYEADYEACEGLQKLAGKIGLAIMVAHHDRKAEAEDVFDTVSGTLGLTGGVDTIAILKRKGSGDGAPVTLHIEGRDLEEEIAKAVRRDKETCRWTIIGEAAEVQRSTERTRILAALKHASEGLSVTEIVARACLASRNAAYLMLGRMCEDGAVERIKNGLYGLPGTRERMSAAKANANGAGKRQIDRSEPIIPKNQEDNNLSPNLSAEMAETDRQKPICQSVSPKKAETDPETDLNILNGQGKSDQSVYLSASSANPHSPNGTATDTDDDITPWDQLHPQRTFQ
jgi:hypothetical protein